MAGCHSNLITVPGKYYNNYANIIYKKCTIFKFDHIMHCHWMSRSHWSLEGPLILDYVWHFKALLIPDCKDPGIKPLFFHIYQQAIPGSCFNILNPILWKDLVVMSQRRVKSESLNYQIISKSDIHLCNSQSNFRGINQFQTNISGLSEFVRSYDETPFVIFKQPLGLLLNQRSSQVKSGQSQSRRFVQA